jgi:preprotein translocase subunit SecG
MDVSVVALEGFPNFLSATTMCCATAVTIIIIVIIVIQLNCDFPNLQQIFVL